MRILFLTDNFPPEYNAPATRTHEHCKEWVKAGAEVTVITCFPNFPQGKIFEGYKNKLYEKEWIDGIKVIRVWSFISSNKGFFKRTLDFISFAIMSFFAGLGVKTDVIIATSPQFFTAVSGYLLSLFKRRKWIMEVRDLWPESISAVGAVKTGWILTWMEKLELFLYRKSHIIIVVTDAFKKNISSRGISKNKIHVIKNGANLMDFSPRNKSQAIKSKLGLDGELIIGYIGTHGLAHSLDFIVNSIKELHNENIKFLFIGDGAQKENVQELAKSLNLNNIIFSEPVRKNAVPEYLSVIDIALVPLKKSDTFKTVIPSKIFESAAMGKPILLGVDGESRSIIEHYTAGEYFEPENEADFLKKTLLMSRNIRNNKDYAQGCHRLAHEFDRKKLAEQMLDIVNSIHS